jgi:hypothetical protein
MPCCELTIHSLEQPQTYLYALRMGAKKDTVFKIGGELSGKLEVKPNIILTNEIVLVRFCIGEDDIWFDFQLARLRKPI